MLLSASNQVKFVIENCHFSANVTVLTLLQSRSDTIKCYLLPEFQLKA